MRFRIVLAHFLKKTGSFIQSLSIMVMRPNDLIEFSRQTYAKLERVASWSTPELVDGGLNSAEKDLLEKLPLTRGQLLLLGVGGGREAIPLAEIGFQVTGVDFIPEMINEAKKNAARHGLKINGLVQEISQLEIADHTYDVVWLSAAMYSCVPTQKKRVEMLRRIFKVLRTEGYFICQFHLGADKLYSPKIEKIRKTFAWLTLGNISYEQGDMLWENIEFVHGFLSEAELRREFSAGGFEVDYLYLPKQRIRGGALLIKSNMEGG